LHEQVRASETFPPLLIVHMGSPEEGERFFESRWPEARAVSDPEKKLYAAFGLGKGKLSQFLGPAIWGAGLRALLGGHGVGLPVGDPAMMSGHFLIRDGAIVWSHLHANSGETRRYEEIELALRNR
jgi:hypothetical protein